MNNFIKTATLLFLVWGLQQTARAQGAYETAMDTAFHALGETHEPGAFATLANRFEQIGNVAGDHWEPLYYAAYCRLMAGIMQSEPAQKDPFFDQALKLVEAADARQADNSEIHALQGYVLLMKMTVDPQNRFYLIGQAEAVLEEAIQLDPANPRPDFIKGQNTFYTPEPFGGGAKAAKPLLERAKEKFDAFKADGKYAPNWGQDRCEYLLGEVE
ncbi:hypothetical protein [Parapedobacter sp. DT-150]|uniref:hypothetical protein n=1 Tax=Parapedobacter sp. DT-150 TaxID=3396162 RepID=UPI003F196EB7